MILKVIFWHESLEFYENQTYVAELEMNRKLVYKNIYSNELKRKATKSFTMKLHKFKWNILQEFAFFVM